ncbi:hypothetical protein CSPB12327_07700 [Campylobacter sp. RM12327]|uniref:hypothetical protein n=1 Tax=Campylobacter sputorum TaxID=206 RepID=UPI0013747F56|nr:MULTISPECIES: hypothetical protein [Campylobacter]MBE7358828.1 hypothetical protein [Campylobacter sp. RM11302]MBF6670018.1 hypothetical protein [Campylobacter sp. RM12327]MBF6674214.1 hypothetical protein [Campylobacter sp. RM13538]MBF6676639.1 hypothetical protein [Campylobacter sp. RM12321]MBF6678417.1 hypothetical protein [Campylobacter sp. RM11259]
MCSLIKIAVFKPVEAIEVKFSDIGATKKQRAWCCRKCFLDIFVANFTNDFNVLYR